ncbi:MAG: heavy-metal-associated domain-containing protein [Bacteroidota bacterium]
MTYKYSSNINCGGCVASVSPVLDDFPAVQSWKVDIQHKQKILTIEGEQLDEKALKKKLAEIGFEIKPVKRGFLGKVFS